MVYKMAAVGCMADNSSMDSEDTGEASAPTLAEICKKNGVAHSCFHEEKSCHGADTKGTRLERTSRINGTAKGNLVVAAAAAALAAVQPSIPNLRSRKDKQRCLPDSTRKRRRSSRHDKTELPESHGCCCHQKKLRAVEVPPRENNNTSVCIVQPTSKVSTESSQNAIFGLPKNCDVLSVDSCVGPSIPSPVPCTLLSCGVVNCALGGASHPCKDAQTFSCNCKESLTQCKWKNCDILLDPNSLMDHIREKHVESQDGSETFVCLWDGCKVFNKQSCSMSWLERHMLSHSGDKPFKCIVDGCEMRFTSHSGLERHVNSHFNASQPSAPKPTKVREDTPTKLWKKKKIRRKRPQLVRTGDFFDSGIMERLQQELVTLTRITQIDLEGSTDSITFHGTVIAKRTEESGKVKVLLHWTPEDVFPDCWVLESQVSEMYKRVIPLTSLPQETAATLHPSFYRRHRYRKHRRK